MLMLKSSMKDNVDLTFDELDDMSSDEDDTALRYAFQYAHEDEDDEDED